MNHPTTQNPSIVGRPLSRRPIRGFLGVCFVLITMLVALAPQVWGQENATINGTVSDSTGALVPNAAITLTNPATGQVRQSVSNSSGAYLFPNVGIGAYTPVSYTHLPCANNSTRITLSFSHSMKTCCSSRSGRGRDSRLRAATWVDGTITPQNSILMEAFMDLSQDIALDNIFRDLRERMQ